MAAVPSAVPSLGNAVNIPVASPATERYPGAVDPSVYTQDYPSPFNVEGPIPGTPGDSPFGVSGPSASSGGGVVDATWLTGTDAPTVPWDSSGGQAVTPNLSYPGATNPELHSDDGSGAVAAAQTVVPAYIGDLTRSTVTGQTFNREYVFEPVNGMWVPSANGRIDFDQTQTWDPSPGDGGGYAPWDPGYSERPVLLNVAYQAYPVTSAGNQYSVNGLLPDRSQWNAYEAQAYEAPPDPIVNQPAAPAPSGSGGWLLNG
jgi:hypothetical protein